MLAGYISQVWGDPKGGDTKQALSTSNVFYSKKNPVKRGGNVNGISCV